MLTIDRNIPLGQFSGNQEGKSQHRCSRSGAATLDRNGPRHQHNYKPTPTDPPWSQQIQRNSMSSTTQRDTPAACDSRARPWNNTASESLSLTQPGTVAKHTSGRTSTPGSEANYSPGARVLARDNAAAAPGAPQRPRSTKTDATARGTNATHVNSNSPCRINYTSLWPPNSRTLTGTTGKDDDEQAGTLCRDTATQWQQQAQYTYTQDEATRVRTGLWVFVGVWASTDFKAAPSNAVGVRENEGIGCRAGGATWSSPERSEGLL